MPKPKPKKTSSAPAAPEPTRRSARAAEASAAANAPLCALAGALDEEGNFVGTWSLPDGSDPAEFSYEVETAPFDDDGSFTLTLAGAFVFGGAPRRDEMALTVRGAAVSGLGRSEIGDYRVAGAVEGDAWRLQKLPPLPKASDSEDDAPPPPPPPKRKPRRSSTTDVRELPPPDGAKLFVRWKGDDGALGSGPDGYYRCALVDGDVVGADPGIWEGDPVAFDPARDDWRYAENAFRRRAIGSVQRVLAARGLGPDGAGVAAPEKKPRRRSTVGPDARCSASYLKRKREEHGAELVDLCGAMVQHVADHSTADVVCAHACGLTSEAFAAGWARGDTLVRPLRGINIQDPWARRILDGDKTVEARTYDVGKYADEWLWVVETPGAEGRKAGRKHRVAGLVRFAPTAVRYENLDAWRADEGRHRIAAGSPFDWDGASPMFGWVASHVYKLAEPAPGPETKGVISCRPMPRLVRVEGVEGAGLAGV